MGNGAVVYMRPAHERREAAKVREHARVVKGEVLSVAERIRRINRIYQERLEGRRK